MIALYIDADACPVKQEVYRVAERHALKGTALKVYVVSNSPIAVPREEMIQRVVVGSGMDEADNWIAERAGAGAVVITADVPLASRAVKAGAEAIAPNGRAFTADSIGMTLATRNLMDSLRRRRRNMDTFANNSVSAAIADKDNTTRRGPAVCRAAAEEDCRMSQTSRRTDQRTHRYRHWCARGACCSATARG
jgi:uncharacterized protein